MYSPELYEPETTRDLIQEFGGYNHNVRIGENEFYDMKNLSSANYPTLSPRCKRGKKNEIGECHGLLAKNGLAYVKENTFYYEKDGDIYSYGLDREYDNQERRLVSMGAYLIVYPDMLCFNTVDIDLALATDNGKNIKPELMYNEKMTIKGNFIFQLCHEDGTEIKLDDLLIDVKALDDSKTGFLAKNNEAIYIDNLRDSMHLEGIIEDWADITCKHTRPSDDGTGEYEHDLVKASEEEGYLILARGDKTNDDCFLDIVLKQLATNSSLSNIVLSKEATIGSINVTCETIMSNTRIERTYPIKVRYVENGVARLWEPIKLGMLRLKVREDGEYAYQRCESYKEHQTAQEIWDDPSCWRDILVSLKISNENLKLAVEKILQDKTTDQMTIDSRNAIVGLKTLAKPVKDVCSLLGKHGDILLLSESINYVGRTEEIDATFTISPVIKKFDYLIESHNRLFGCRYGENVDGKFVNEIYATALGAFKCWDVFDKTDQDSYVVSVGSDGPFTAAINYRGYPMFFKENCFHMIYGAYPSAYQLVTETGTGVKAGSDKSLCIIQNVLYYHSHDGIYRYDGSSYEKISGALGFENYKDAVAGSIDNKYYVAMTAENGTRELFVYDIGKGLWHKEDAVNVQYFARYGNDLYFVADDYLWTVKGTSGEPEPQPVEWYAESGEIGYSTPDAKYVDKLQLRLSLPVGSSVSLYIEYDSDEYWQFIGNVEGKSFQAFTLPILPRRCDHFRIRISGVGECKIFSLSKILENGGDV